MAAQGTGSGEPTQAPLTLDEAGKTRRPISLGDLVQGFINTQRSQVSGKEGAVSDETESESYRKRFEENEAQKHRHREMLTPALRNITQGWIISVVFFLFWQGFGSKIGFFHLSDNVLVTLLTTATVNVLGLFWLALKYLYSNPEYNSPDRQRTKKKATSGTPQPEAKSG